VSFRDSIVPVHKIARANENANRSDQRRRCTNHGQSIAEQDDETRDSCSADNKAKDDAKDRLPSWSGRRIGSFAFRANAITDELKIRVRP
jgi:hypothetical protein